MSTLTEQQFIDLRADLGDTAEPPAFSDDELQALWDRAEFGHTKTVLWGLDQLLVSAIKFTDYAQNQSDEKKSQIFDHLVKVRAIWNERLDREIREALIAQPSAMTRLRPLWRNKSRPYA